MGGGAAAAGSSWCTNYVWDVKPDGLVNGLLWPYNSSLAIYHCPADRSTITTLAGEKLPQLRWRSYNMSLSVNGRPDLNPIGMWVPSFRTFTEIRNPHPTNLWVFLDVHEDEILRVAGHKLDLVGRGSVCLAPGGGCVVPGVGRLDA